MLGPNRKISAEKFKILKESLKSLYLILAKTKKNVDVFLFCFVANKILQIKGQNDSLSLIIIIIIIIIIITTYLSAISIAY